MKLAIAVVAIGASVARADPWPRAAIDRPLTLDRGLIEAEVSAGAARWRVLGLALHDDAIAIGARWGISDRWQLDLATAIDVAPDAQWTGLVRAAAARRVIEDSRLDLAATARLDGCAACGFSIFSTAALGAPLRWRASDRAYVHAGREILPVTLRPYVALDLSLRAGAGLQLTHTIAAELDAELARVTVIGQWRDDRWLANAPLRVSALASIAPRVDLGVSAGVDHAFDPRDGWRVLVTVAGRSR